MSRNDSRCSGLSVVGGLPVMPLGSDVARGRNTVQGPAPDWLQIGGLPVMPAVSAPAYAQRSAAAQSLTASTLDAVWIDLESHNSAETRTFGPAAGDKTDVTRLRATVANPPRRATYKWSNASGRVEFDPDNALTTTVRGFTPGVGSVQFEVKDAAGELQAHDSIWIGVPEFATAQQYGGATYQSPVQVADPHLFNTVLADYGLTAEKNEILRIARELSDHLLRHANVRTVWRVGATIDAVPAHLQRRATAGHRIHNNIVIAGYPRGANRHKIGDTFAPAGTRTFDETIFIYPGAIDGGAIPEIVQARDAFLAAQQTHANNPTAATRRILTALADLWREIVGRLIGHTIAHEIGHSMLGDSPGLDAGGHTRRPDVDLLSTVPLDLVSATGIEITTPADLVNGAGFAVGGFNLVTDFSADNQAMFEVMHPVPPAAPFDT